MRSPRRACGRSALELLSIDEVGGTQSGRGWHRLLAFDRLLAERQHGCKLQRRYASQRNAVPVRNSALACFAEAVALAAKLFDTLFKSVPRQKIVVLQWRQCRA